MVERLIPIRLGKRKGAPKNALKWVWACACDNCMQLPPEQAIAGGPFRTRREAEADAEQKINLAYGEPEGHA